jgi:hypothetical protein
VVCSFCISSSSNPLLRGISSRQVVGCFSGDSTRHAASRRSSSSQTRRTTSSRHLPLGVTVQSIFGHFDVYRSVDTRPSEPTGAHPPFTSSIFRFFRIRRMRFTVADSTRSLRHPFSGSPRPFRPRVSWESLGLDTHVSSFLRANHTDSLLGPPFFGSQESGNSGVATKMMRVCGVTGTYTPDRVAFGGTAMSRGLCLLHFPQLRQFGQVTCCLTSG